MANQQLNAKLVICSVPTRNSAAAQQFYNALLGGTDFAPSLNDQLDSYYRPISDDGLTLTVAARQSDREPITCYFAVDNLDETVKQLQAAGGTVVVNPAPVNISAPDQAKQVYAEVVGQPAPDVAGRWVGMTDPDGNYLALMQLDSATQQQLNAGPANRKLSQTQVDRLERWKQRGGPTMHTGHGHNPG
jgi:predicted enzyme related to lactoylglutathione lyase